MQATMDPARGLVSGEGEAIWFLGSLVTVKTGGEETGDAFSIAEHVYPAGFGPPPHIHRNEDEAFYVLEGEVAFFSGGTTFRGGPVAYVRMPRGLPHTFRVEGDTPARLLIVTAPAGFERFIRDAGVPAADRTAPTPAATGADIKWKLATVPRYGIEFPPPPGGRNGKDCVAPTGRMPRILAGPTDPPGPRRRS